jgi:hypothetical protein
VSDYQEQLWGVRGLSRREERATDKHERAIAVLTPLLERDERLSLLGANAWSWPWFRPATVAISSQRVFVVFWGRGGLIKRTVIADRGSVRARVVDEDVRIHGPWGTIEVQGPGVSRGAHGIVALINGTLAQGGPDDPP